jgi:hypothetical protein
MMINVAFYDEKRRRLVAHERLGFSRQSAAFPATQMGMLWKSGKHSLPSRYWVVWEDIDDLGVFPLDQVDSDEFSPLPEDMLDHILECARIVSRPKR